MAHSVSHNLFLDLNGSDLTVATARKDGLVVDLQFYPLPDNQMLDTIIAELPEIYSDITLLVRNKDFITIPEKYYSSDITELYKISYNLKKNHHLILDKSEYGIGIVYEKETNFTNSIEAKFSRLKVIHEVTAVLSKLFKEVNFKKPRILISINETNLIIYAIKEGKLLLCNPFKAKTNDDIFYFVMLTIEQLHFLHGETELVILGEPPNRIEIYELFKNYINEINIWLDEYKYSPDLKNTSLISHSFALQTLLCE